MGVKNTRSYLFLGFFLILSLLVGCTNSPPNECVCPKQTCSYEDYISKEDANEIINITNTLVDLSNDCYVEQIKYLNYYD